MKIVIATKHAGAIEWLRYHGVAGEIVSHLTQEKIERLCAFGEEALVVGVLPFGVISKLRKHFVRVWIIDLPSILYTDRGREMTPSEMDRAGARLVNVYSAFASPLNLDHLQEYMEYLEGFNKEV